MYSAIAAKAAAVMIEDEQQPVATAVFQAYLQQPGEYPRRVTAAAAVAPLAPLAPPSAAAAASHANSPIPYDSTCFNEQDDLLVTWNFADLGLEIPKEDEEEEVAPVAAPAAVETSPAAAVPVVTPTGSTKSAQDIKNTKKQQPVVHKWMNAPRRAGKKKPPGAPKRPLSAYNIFFKNERPKVLREMLGGVSFEQLGKLIGERWRALDQGKRKIYEHHANKDVLRYRKQMDNFEDARRQRFRHYPPQQQQHQLNHPVVVSYDMNMVNKHKQNHDMNESTLPCVSFEEANAIQSSSLPIIHHAPPPLYQLPLAAPDTATRDCRTPCSPEPNTTISSQYQTTSLAQAPAPPPVTPPTPRPVVLPQLHFGGAAGNNSSGMLDPINLDDDDSPASCQQDYSYSYCYPNYSNSSSSSSSQYHHPYSPRHHLAHFGEQQEQQLVLPKPPGRCLGGPPEHIAIPQGMEVYLPTTRTVFISSPSSSSSSSSATSDHGEHDNSSNNYHRHGQEQHQQQHEQQQQQQQQRVIVTGRRKYKVYYSAYRMKRSEADDYLQRLSDTLASWNTSVSATMASPMDSFVLNDHDEHHETHETTSCAAATAPPLSPPRPPLPAVARGGSGAGQCLPYYHHHDTNDHSYGEMRDDSRRYS